MKAAYRLLRVKNGKPHTLFHGFHGSRELVQDKVLKAVKRPVQNPGKKNGRVFISGWHILPTRHLCEDYLQRFKNKDDIVVCKVFVSCTRPKPGSEVTLADYMKIKSIDWTVALKEYGHA